MLDDETPNSLVKIRLYPTKSQTSRLNKMFGSHRAVYIKLVDCSREDYCKLKTAELTKTYRLISQKHSLANSLSEDHLEVPEEIMDSTFRDFTKALKPSMALFVALKKKDEKTAFPELRFKSKNDNSSTTGLRARNARSSDSLVKFSPRYFSFSKTEGTAIKEVVPDLQFSVRFQCTRDERFHICIPRAKSFEQTSSSKACAIDSSVRSFITMYDPDGLTLGADDKSEYIFLRCLTIDRLISRRTMETSRGKRYRMRKRLTNSFRRVKILIADMHLKVSDWLSKNDKEVLLPKFEMKTTTLKQKRISSKTSHAMLTSSHYKFKMMLTYKMPRTGERMIQCDEHYTTKTCSYCERLNRGITSEKVFPCSHCHLTLDRDANAARNIFLKNEHQLALAPVVRVPGDAYSEVARCA